MVLAMRLAWAVAVEVSRALGTKADCSLKGLTMAMRRVQSGGRFILVLGRRFSESVRSLMQPMSLPIAEEMRSGVADGCILETKSITSGRMGEVSGRLSQP